MVHLIKGRMKVARISLEIETTDALKMMMVSKCPKKDGLDKVIMISWHSKPFEMLKEEGAITIRRVE